MEIKNDKAASVGEHVWEPGDVVEVSDELAAELVAIKDSGFYDPSTGPAAFDVDQQRREALSAATIGPLDQARGGTKTSEFPAEDSALVTEVDPEPSTPEVDPGAAPVTEVVEPAPETPSKTPAAKK